MYTSNIYCCQDPVGERRWAENVAVPELARVSYSHNLPLCPASHERNADKRYEAFDDFVQYVLAAPFAHKEPSAAAGIRTVLEAEGTPIGPLDVLISLSHGATFVTRNEHEFARIRGRYLENWFA
jgi:predicted nucleic acid-binding protein